MHALTVFIGLLALVTALAAVAERVKIASPIVLVLAGTAISLVPGIRVVGLQPEVVMLVFLPPLIYAAAWNTSWADFKANFRPIFLLAFGLVIFTTAGVAWVAHSLIPGFSWPLAFIVGATVSTTDPIAGTAIIRQMGLPRRLIVILEGESLVNDGTGLIVYRYAVAAVTTGQFVLLQAGEEFVISVIGGVAIGLALAWVVRYIHRLTAGVSAVETTLSLLTPFAAYLLAERVEVSGVLAVLASGLYLTLRSSEYMSRRGHLETLGVWNVMTFMLNSTVFVLMGLQLRRLLTDNRDYTFGTLIVYGSLVSLAVIATRFIWVFVVYYVPRLFSPSLRSSNRTLSLKLVTVLAFTGMRGVLSLATALALPLTLGSGAPFPKRDLIIFIAYCVIFVTLVIQGTALPYLIRLMAIKPDQREEQEELRLRIQLATRAIEHLEANYSLSDEVSDEALAMLKHKYEARIDRLRVRQGGKKRASVNESELRETRRIQLEIIQLERDEATRLRRAGQHDDEVLRAVLFELDLEEGRLELEEG
ncbi:Na+/H+ antiporter [Spirosoma luteolum]